MPAASPTTGRRARPTSRASSPARSARPTSRCRSRPKVDDPAFRSATFDEVRLAYREQVRGLLDGGVDALLVETIFDTLTSKAALVAVAEEQAARGTDLPLMISVTITDRSGRTLSGQTLDAFYTSIEHARPFSVGINCALGAREMRPYMAELARIAGTLRDLLPQRRAAQRLRRVRPAGRGDRGAAGRVRRERLPEHRRRLLRHHAGAHRRHRPGRRRHRAAAASGRRRTRQRLRPPHPLLGPRDAGAAPRQQLPDDRRAHQRHRLEALRAAGARPRTGPGPRRWRSTRCAAAPTSSTSTWTRACSTRKRA